jgi:SCY1-like protein 2
MHKNIQPESIIINSNGAWKLAGFELFVSNNNDPNDSVIKRKYKSNKFERINFKKFFILKVKFPFKEWDGSVPYFLNQPLEYLAPEYGISNKCDASSDMFSYGMLFYCVFNNGKTLYNCHNSYSTFVSCVEEVKI